MLDTLHAVDTPEGVDLSLRVAGPVARAFAWGIDTLLRFAIWGAMAIALGSLGRFGGGLVWIFTFLIWWLFPVVFEIYANGRTPGKRRMVKLNGLLEEFVNLAYHGLRRQQPDFNVAIERDSAASGTPSLSK